jgi:PD-(D/E)XK nuclease superfamily
MKDLAASVASATWTVDAEALRAVLDRLRAALPEAARASVHEEPLEYRQVGERLRSFLARLEQIDLSTVKIWTDTARSGPQLPHLLDVFEGLHQGLKGYVTRVLGDDKIEVLLRLLSSSVPDMLHILGRSADENAHSDLIAWLLDPRRAPTVARHALRRLATYLPEHQEESWPAHFAEAVATESISIRREVVIARDFEDAGDLSRVDIVVSGPRFMLAIENKVWSHEHSDQTCTYWDWLQSMRGLRGGLLLSPSGMAASCGEFSSISYLDLVGCLLEGPTIEPLTSGEEIVLSSYLKTLAREITQVEMRTVLELAMEREQS